jgi:hypothetical protein
MVTAALILIAVASGLAIGWLVHRLAATRLRSTWTRGVLSLTSSALVFFSTGAVFLLFEWTTPAIDARKFTDVQDLHVEVVPDSDTPDASSLTITLVMPDAARSNDDFAVRLTVTAKQSSFEKKITSAALLTPPWTKARTLHSCSGLTLPPAQENMIVACSGGTSTRIISWDVSPTGVGSARVAVRLLNEPIFPMWQATVSLNGEKLVRTRAGLEFGNHQHGSSYVERYEPVLLSPNEPAVEISGVGVDLNSMQFRITVPVLTTLGVSARTYGYLAVAGTALASLLGTGWLWQFLSRRHAGKQNDGSQTKG